MPGFCLYRAGKGPSLGCQGAWGAEGVQPDTTSDRLRAGGGRKRVPPRSSRGPLGAPGFAPGPEWVPGGWRALPRATAASGKGSEQQPQRPRPVGRGRVDTEAPEHRRCWPGRRGRSPSSRPGLVSAGQGLCCSEGAARVQEPAPLPARPAGALTRQHPTGAACSTGAPSAAPLTAGPPERPERPLSTRIRPLPLLPAPPVTPGVTLIRAWHVPPLRPPRGSSSCPLGSQPARPRPAGWPSGHGGCCPRRGSHADRPGCARANTRPGPHSFSARLAHRPASGGRAGWALGPERAPGAPEPPHLRAAPTEGGARPLQHPGGGRSGGRGPGPRSRRAPSLPPLSLGLVTTEVGAVAGTPPPRPGPGGGAQGCRAPEEARVPRRWSRPRSAAPRGPGAGPGPSRRRTSHRS